MPKDWFLIALPPIARIQGGEVWAIVIPVAAVLVSGIVLLHLALSRSATSERRAGIARMRGLLQDAVRRTILMLVIGIVVDLILAIAYAVHAASTARSWFLLIAVYYLCLDCTRFLLIWGAHRLALEDDARRRERIETRAARRAAWMLLAITAVFAMISLFVIAFSAGYKHSLPGSIALLATAIIRIVLSCLGIMGFRDMGPLVRAVKDLSLASALVSLFASGNALINLHQVSRSFYLRANALIGGLVLGLLIWRGIAMLVRTPSKKR